MKKNLLTYFLAIFVIITGFFVSVHTAQASSTDNIYGWGWSDTIGWISFNNCSDPAVASTCLGQSYGVKYDTTGDVTGYAWSDTIGWIQFGGLGGFPGVGGQAHIDTTTGQMTGWAKAISLENPNDNEFSSDWADGWISLSGLASNGAKSPYGISFNMTSGLPNANSFAWGSNVLGWITFGQVKLKTTLVTTLDPKIILTVTELNASNVPVNVTGGTTPPPNKASATSTTTVSGSDGTAIINGHKLKIEWGAQDVDYATCEGRNTYSDTNWDWNPPSYFAPFTPATSWGSAITNILSPAQETNIDFTLRCKAKNANKPLDPYITATINIDVKAPAPSVTLYANGQTNANGNIIYVQLGGNVTLSSKGNNLDLGTSGSGDWPTADPVKGVLCPKALNIFTNYIPFSLDTIGVYTYNISCFSDTGNRIDGSVTVNVVTTIPNTQKLLLRITDLTDPTNIKDALSDANNKEVSSTLSGDILEGRDIKIEWGTDNIPPDERQSKCFASSSVASNWNWLNNPYDATINPSHLGSATSTPSIFVSPLPGSITYQVACPKLNSGISLTSSITVNIKPSIVTGGDSLTINPISPLDCRADSFFPEVKVSPKDLDLSSEKCVFRITGPNGFLLNTSATPSPSAPSTSYSIGGLPGNSSTSLQNYDVTLICSTISSNTETFGINSCVQTSSLTSNMRDMCLKSGDQFTFTWSSTNMVNDSCVVTETDQNGKEIKSYNVATSDTQSFPVNSPLSSFKLSCQSSLDGAFWSAGPALVETADKNGVCHTVKAKRKAPIYKEI